MTAAGICFVVMGFRRRVDFPTGRTLDLDKSYRLLVKPAVEESGLRCVRADEIPHSGVIDVPMYRHLLESDLVIADLSTSNPNAFYELGVRHALRPFSTIVIAESQLQYPFDVAHTLIRSYQHLGDAIDYEEVLRFRGELKTAIAAVLAAREKDSPVYTYLPALRPPSVGAGRGGGKRAVMRGTPGIEGTAAAGTSADELIEQGNARMEEGAFPAARDFFAAAHAMRPADRPWTANDDYLLLRLAAATAWSGAPDLPASLAQAEALLEPLKPVSSQNPEVLELSGALARERWTLTRERPHLERAVTAFERAFAVRHDPFDGLEYAILLNVRAGISDPADAVTDFVLAQRIRRRVVALCEARVHGEPAAGAAGSTTPEIRPDTVMRYRVRAALAEAWLGLDDQAQSARWLADAAAFPVGQAERQRTEGRLGTVRGLIVDSPLRFLAT